MEFSVIYDFLSHDKIYPYREELEKEENTYTRWVRESREKLEKTLNEEQLKLVDTHLHNLCLLNEYIECQVGIRTLNFGIKIGVQLQKSIKDLYEFLDESNVYE